jgi:hypothetical protein
MSNVAQIIERIRKLARVAARIDSALDELHGINRDLGIRYGDPKTQARIRDTNEAEVELEEFLNGFGLETLRRIEALMYSGRGDGSAVELRGQLALNHETKEDIVRTILEKRVSFDAYFDRGIDRAKADGLDLDTF